MLGELGAVVEEVSIPLTAHGAVLSQIPLVVEPALNMKEWVRERLQDYGHNNRIGLLTGSIFPAQAYYKAQKLRTMFRNQVHEALERYDVLVTPTASVAAQPIVEDPVRTSKEDAAPLTYLQTRTFNMASAPAVSINCGLQRRRTAHRPANRGAPRSRPDRPECSLRLRTGHGLAQPPSARRVRARVVLVKSVRPSYAGYYRV